MKDKVCENCHYAEFFDIDDDFLYCRKNATGTSLTTKAECFTPHLLGWVEITPDNVDEINADLIVVTDGTCYKMANEWHASLSTLAKVGGYYYLVLPELKLEETK